MSNKNNHSAGRKQPIYLADYQAPDFSVAETHLTFDLEPSATRVHGRLLIKRQGKHDRPLVLDGDNLKTLAVRLDGDSLAQEDYAVDTTRLTVADVPDEFWLETECEIDPEGNTALNGLYRSNGIYCSQCEPEGFRRITWFPDRPDVLSEFHVTINAKADSCPVMLSNGNAVSREDLGDGRHSIRWHDPWPKPSYLFALVAGDLGCIRDEFATRSGRKVQLEIYTEHHNIDQCDHAMASLKKSMAWDESVYGREYDLDIFMIVAVDDFNMGAMENKGLNIFNSRFVLARPDTATDADYDGIEGVIGHEYFHNWSGNRVTCRDWFQLSLKEGFTVFRDQEFSADMGSRGVKRVSDVNLLRSHQFPEDHGPMAHPVRPASYVEINNFYTVTVYEKGAEVVRMLHNLLGAEQFRRGCDLYFERHDGQAVTTDDFVRAHEDASNRRLDQFRRWYDQAGTPVVNVDVEYHPDQRRCDLRMLQSCPPTPEQESKQPFHIPIAGALFSAAGAPILSRSDPERDATHEHVFELTDANQVFCLYDVEEQPVASLLRGFSAPVKMHTGQNSAELAVLMAHDTDPFNRWDAGQRLAMAQILGGIGQLAEGTQIEFDEAYLAAFGDLLEQSMDDRSLHAHTLMLPDHALIAEEMETIDPRGIQGVRNELQRVLGKRYQDKLLALYRDMQVRETYAFDKRQIGRRALRGVLLNYLAAADPVQADTLAVEQFERADNMTETMSALGAMCNWHTASANTRLEQFFERWQSHSLIVDKWLGLQSRSPHMGTLERVTSLLSHPAYNHENPNKVRALVGGFSHGNPKQFHGDDGKGYEFLADQVLLLDAINPQIAARLVSALNHWRRYADPWRSHMRAALLRIEGQVGLSDDVGEIVGRALGSV